MEQIFYPADIRPEQLWYQFPFPLRVWNVDCFLRSTPEALPFAWSVVLQAQDWSPSQIPGATESFSFLCPPYSSDPCVQKLPVTSPRNGVCRRPPCHIFLSYYICSKWNKRRSARYAPEFLCWYYIIVFVFCQYLIVICYIDNKRAYFFQKGFCSVVSLLYSPALS